MRREVTLVKMTNMVERMSAMYAYMQASARKGGASNTSRSSFWKKTGKARRGGAVAVATTPPPFSVPEIMAFCHHDSGH